jgi:hypothetical protein
VEYSLEMIDQGDVLQYVPISRAEFIALKKHLATIRGQKPAKQAA